MHPSSPEEPELPRGGGENCSCAEGIDWLDLFIAQEGSDAPPPRADPPHES
ncbi:hypothetical protein [Kitasatospora sp. NPDC085879]|uniref:hypothetical protein n=1 Tax=Kitasatospora sp. NPDC085879 TaxID=3154769 RepID=UPI003434C0C8